MTPQQLKNSILQLAIQGKLVPQDPNDEPASVLIDRIREEKARLVREKKIKKDKNSSYIYRGSDKVFYEVRNGAAPVPIDDQLPFDIPDSWTWARLGEVLVECLGGGTPSKSNAEYWNGNIPWASVKDMPEPGGTLDHTIDSITAEGVENCSTNIVNNDYIVVCTRVGVGKIAKVNGEIAINQDLRGLKPNKELSKDYLICVYIMLNAGLDWSGTTVKGISCEELLNMLLPLPPITEQKRIVERLYKIENLVSEYKKSWCELEILKQTFPKSIKKSILQEAIQGKLVPQIPEEGSTQELLAKIRAEKERLVREGKLKPTTLAAPVIERRGNSYYENGRCIDDEIPFDIPDSWAWVRIRDCMDLRAGKFITANAISPVETESTPYMCYGGHGLRGYVSTFNTRGRHALIGRQGALCGNVQLAEGDFYATEHAIVVSLYGGLDVEWVYYFVRALNLNQYSTATAQPGLSVATINDVYIPLPPLGEQKRIVLALKKTESLITNR